ncbi:hypothetical protein MANES_07G056008v8 [Manihot esculenta]|uniref:Uncharacterized protein n=1 Tax=Manihot esculenta TaxID=3983 RepID=A0ACB7HEL4_MANES|nr:hypothetical protein MANES_07G056008v8 [Manihot esculenta]
MERLFESLSGRSMSSSSSKSSSKKSTKNKEILLAPDLDTSLNNWELPPISSDLIYKSNFMYKSDYVIKTVEHVTLVHGDMQSLNLLSEELVKKHQEKYLFLHIGMIQVAVKPATRLGLNIAAMLCVRDKRHLKFNDSLLGVVESSLCDGPIFFQCYPNLILSLTDPHILQTLILDVKTMGYDMLPGSENLILIYRIHYKAMNTIVPNLRDKATKLISPKGTTTLFVTNMSKGNLIIPKSIQWDQVNLADSWILEEAAPPKKEESTTVQSRSLGGRRSYSGASLMPEPLPPWSSVYTPIQRSNSVIGVRRTEEQVANPVYEMPQSPTPSDMGYDTESVLFRSFKIMILEKKKHHSKNGSVWRFPIENRNYGGENMVCIRIRSRELSRVENQVSKIAAQPSGVDILPQKEKAESSDTKMEEKVLFKPMDSKSINIKLDKKEEMLEELTKRLAKLGLKEDTKKKSIVPLTMESEIEIEEKEKQNEEEELAQLESMLQEIEPAEVNRIKYPKAQATMDLKPYYPRPSPINLQYEDVSYNPVQVDGSSIIEWNIDGLSDYQIKNVFQYMTMHATACRAKGNDDPATARALISGFSGQLKGWWDFSVSNEGKAQIFNMNKQEGERQVPDVVNTLLYTIGLHFIGSVSMFTDGAQEQLINLRCPDLSHFKWYKDAFFSLVFTREDSQNNHNGNIPYHSYTYGELASEVVTAGILLCNELKIHKQMQKEQFYGKQILGSFCEQYGLPPLKFPPTKFTGGRRKEDNIRHRHQTKHFHRDKGGNSQLFKLVSRSGANKTSLFFVDFLDEDLEELELLDLPERDSNSLSILALDHCQRFTPNTPTPSVFLANGYATWSHKPKEKRKPNQGKAEKTIVCYRCGKVGHYANKCRVKQHIQALTIEEDLKEALAKILLNETDSEQEVVALNALDYTTEEEESSTEEDEEQKEGCEGNCDYYKSLCAMNGLLVLTREDNLILDLIDNIENPEKKREKLETYINLYKDKDSSTSTYNPIEKKIDSKQSPYDLKEILERVKNSKRQKEPTVVELRSKLNSVKIEIKELKERINILELLNEQQQLAIEEPEEEHSKAEVKGVNNLHYINMTDRVITHKWHTKITIVVHKEYLFETNALIDSGADLNCINEGLVLSKYFSKTVEELHIADGSKMTVRYKLKDTAIYNQGICFEIPFLMVKGLSHHVILGNPFLHMLYPIQQVTKEGISTVINRKVITFHFTAQPKVREIDVLKSTIESKTKFINSLKQEVVHKSIEERLKEPKIQQRIKIIQEAMLNSICAESPYAFWTRKKHVAIPTKARRIAMGPRHLEICKKEIADCPAFYVENAAELERGVPRLVINYKPLNKALRWVRYPLPNKRDLLNRLYEATIFSKFDMKSGYWQIQIVEEDKYKTVFTVPFGHYEWNVMPFGLKNAHSEFQKIMNEIFNAYSTFSIVYSPRFLGSERTQVDSNEGPNMLELNSKNIPQKPPKTPQNNHAKHTKEG